ncbi:MAG TPA: DUF502 domain-containing protein [bacterium]|nr:DUF502 domain-containing protein [bacterium]
MGADGRTPDNQEAIETPQEVATVAPERPSAGKVFRRYLFTGLLVLLPVVVTAFVLLRLFFALDRILGGLVETYIGRPLPGVGLVALVALIMGIGAVASNILGSRAIKFGERLVTRVPLIGWIYATTKQLFSTLLEERSQSFRKVVLVSYPTKGTYSVAFLTSESPESVEGGLGKGFVTVFLPTTPNPTSGFLLIVPADEVIPLDMTVDEGLKLVISAGALSKNGKPHKGEGA